jgi:hypothetical protein
MTAIYGVNDAEFLLDNHQIWRISFLHHNSIEIFQSSLLLPIYVSEVFDGQGFRPVRQRMPDAW